MTRVLAELTPIAGRKPAHVGKPEVRGESCYRDLLVRGAPEKGPQGVETPQFEILARSDAEQPPVGVKERPSGNADGLDKPVDFERATGVEGWQELVNQRLDMTEVNKRWLDEYKKEHGLK